MERSGYLRIFQLPQQKEEAFSLVFFALLHRPPDRQGGPDEDEDEGSSEILGEPRKRLERGQESPAQPVSILLTKGTYFINAGSLLLTPAPPPSFQKDPFKAYYKRVIIIKNPNLIPKFWPIERLYKLDTLQY